MPERDSDLLSGWQEIAAFCGWSVSTAQRTAKEHHDFPVRRVDVTGRAAVYAFKDELRAWLRRQGDAEARGDSPQRPPAEYEATVGSGASAARTFFGDRWWPTAVAAGVGSVVVAGTVAGYMYVRRAQMTLTTDSTSLRQGQTINLQVFGVIPGNSLLRWSKTPSGIEGVARDQPILPDAHGETHFSFSPACQTPVGAHQLWIADEKTNRRSNSVTVNVLPEPKCEGPVPDLVAERLSVSPLSVVGGETLNVSLLVRNQGTSSTSECRSRIRLSMSQRSAARDTVLLTFTTPPVLVGDSVTQSFDVRISPNTPPGLYYVTAYIDYLGKFLELENDNNSAASEQIVVVAARQ